MEWLLQQRPGGLLSALIDLALHFHSLLSQQGNRRVFKGGESPSHYSSGGANSLSQLPALMIVLYKIAWYVFYLSFFHFFTSPFFSLPPSFLSLSPSRLFLFLFFLSLPLPSCHENVWETSNSRLFDVVSDICSTSLTAILVSHISHKCM